MLRKEEINVIKFFNDIPNKFKIYFWLVGLIVAVCFCVEFFIPICQKDFINSSIDNRDMYNSSFYYMIALYVSFILFSAISGYSASLFKQVLYKHLFNKYFKTVMNLNKSELNEKGAGYFFDIVTKDSQNVSEFFDSKMFNLFFSLIQTIFIFIILYSWDRVIFLTLLTSFLLTVSVTFYFFKYRRGVFSDIRESSSDVVEKTLDVISNSFTIKLFSMFDRVRTSINNRLVINQNHVKRFFKAYNIVDLVLNSIKYTSFLVMIVLLIDSIIKDNSTYGHLIAYISYFQFIFKPIDYFLIVLGKIANTEVSIKRLNKINQKPAGVIKYPILLNRIKRIEFKNVSFSYTSNKENLLVKDISFEIDTNVKIGLMGISGEGKSTLLKLLYQENIVNTGKILINKNINIYDIPLFQYYNKINIFSQNHEIFNQDLKFNLTVGKKVVSRYEENNRIIYLNKIANDFKRSINKGDITTLEDFNNTYINEYMDRFNFIKIGFEQMSELINSERFISNFIEFSFNNNYIPEYSYYEVIENLDIEKLLNRDFGENGSFLSGGEKQKIMFGRFILKQNYDFFVMDEPFTNLDSINENKLMAVAEKMLKNKMGLIISHQFNLLNNLTSEIIVLKDGEIKESGEHSKLLNNKGLYYSMFEEHKKSYKNIK